MFEFIAGLAVGTAFAPFWLALYKRGKEIVAEYTRK